MQITHQDREIKHIHIRLSKESDGTKIKNLIDLCFGYREDKQIISNLQGRYLIAETVSPNPLSNTPGNIVAITGLYYSDEYKAYELDWTCTHPLYRQLGIMTELLRRICNYTDEEIYCSCWRWSNKSEINLASLMKKFNFHEVLKPRVTWDTQHNCKVACKHCIGKNFGRTEEQIAQGTCRCYEDLYMRPKQSSKEK